MERCFFFIFQRKFPLPSFQPTILSEQIKLYQTNSRMHQNGLTLMRGL